MKIQLKLDGRVIPATLTDSEAARAFAAMLPLTITLHDLFGREKFGALPGTVPRARTQTRDCAPGDIICWTAGPDLAVFHGQDSRPVTGGFHVLGKIDAGIDALAAAGPLTVTIDHPDCTGLRLHGEGRLPAPAHRAAGCDSTRAASSRDSDSVIRG